MESEVIDIEIHQKVGILTMNNPPANAFTNELRDEFILKFNEMSINNDICSFVVTGADKKFFATGVNIPIKDPPGGQVKHLGLWEFKIN